MTEIIIAIFLGILAIDETIAIIIQFRNKHAINEIGRLEDILLNERKHFAEQQKNFLADRIDYERRIKVLKDELNSYKVGNTAELPLDDGSHGK